MFCQRHLCEQIVRGKSDYLFVHQHGQKIPRTAGILH